VEKNLSLYVETKSLSTTEPPADLFLIGDPVKLRQALVNILSNAIKFTEKGAVRFLTNVLSIDSGSAKIHFSVEDSGIGMTPEQITRVFKPFMQADDSITRHYGGTGLGIPITNNIVEMMGGRLEISSKPGYGSTFWFSLIFEIYDESGDGKSRLVTFNELEKPFFDGEILICEDNIMNQQVICEHLTRVGLKTVVAQNGREGVDIVIKRSADGMKPFDLIFMDIHMPVMDGLEAATLIIASGVQTPIVSMSANIMDRDVELYKNNGIRDFINKPFVSQDLWKCLLQYIKPVTVTAVDMDAQAADDEKLLYRLRQNFVNDNQTTYDDIVRAADNGDVKLAHRLAHTLKSNAGQIGEKHLQTAAAAVEDMLRDGENRLTKKLSDALGTELRAVLGKFAPLLKDDGAALNGKQIEGDELLSILEQLGQMLKKRNPGSINILDSIRGVPGTEELARHIGNFEFKQASAALDALKERLKSGA